VPQLVRACLSGCTAAVAAALAASRPRIAALHEASMARMREAVKAAQKQRRDEPPSATTAAAALIYAKLPVPLRPLVKAWARAVADVASDAPGAPLASSGANSTPPAGGRFWRQLLAVQSLSQCLESEDAVWIAADEGALSAALALATTLALGAPGAEADADDAAAVRARREAEAEAARVVRRAVAALFARAISVVKDACPRGFLETGRAKLRRLLTRLGDGLVEDLACALPFGAPPRGAEAATQPDGDASAAAAVVAPPSGEEGAPLPRPSWQPTEARAQASLLLSLCLLVDRDVGLWLADCPGYLPAVFATSGAPHSAWQEVVSDVVAALASDDTGRSLVATLPDRLDGRCDPSAKTRLSVVALLQRLSESSSETVRAGAHVTLAKLTGTTKAYTEASRTATQTLQHPASHAADTQRHTHPHGGGSKATSKAEAKVAEGSAAIRNTALGSVAVDEVLISTIVQVRRASGLRNGASDADTDENAILDMSADETQSVAVSLQEFATKREKFSTLLAEAKAKTSRARIDIGVAMRAVEALSVLSANTRSKLPLLSVACMPALLRISATAVVSMQILADSASSNADWDTSKTATGATSLSSLGDARPTAYGLAYILYCIVTSRSQLHEEKLMEMGVDPKQWKQLQAMMAPKDKAGREADLSVIGAGSPPVVDPDEDPAAQVEERTRILLKYDVLSMIASLADTVARIADDEKDKRGPSTSSRGAATRALLSQVLLHIAEFKWARGPMIQVGLLPVLVSLAADTKLSSQTTDGAMAAGQALARILITTHIGLLSSAQIQDSIPALLRVLRDSSSGFQQFEACMALTNLLASGEEARAHFIRRAGIPALEYCQFSDNVLLRRAGTEALTNLAATSEGSDLILGDRAALWLALSRNFSSVSGEGSAHVPSDVAASSKHPLTLPKTQEEALAMIKFKSKRDASEVDDMVDTPTAVAASGAIAMALMARTSLIEDEEYDDAAQTKVKAAVYNLIDAGVIGAMCELLLSPIEALHPRALAVLAEIAKYTRGAAAILTALSDADIVGEGSGNQIVPDGSSTGFVMDAFTILMLAGIEGKDPAALAIGGKKGLKKAYAPALQRSARIVVARVLKHAEDAGALASASLAAPTKDSKPALVDANTASVETVMADAPNDSTVEASLHKQLTLRPRHIDSATLLKLNGELRRAATTRGQLIEEEKTWWIYSADEQGLPF
jgi:hypothetical protein